MVGTIVHITSVHAPSDPRIVFKECYALSEAGYRVVVIAPGDRAPAVGKIAFRLVRRSGSRWSRMTKTAWSVLHAAAREPGRLYHLHDPELIPLGVLLKIAGRRVVYDVHEHLPLQILGKRWIPERLRPAVSAGARLLEGLAARFFDGVVIANPTSVERFAHRMHEPRIALVQNFPRREEFEVEDGKPYRERDQVVVYIGGVSIDRGLIEMIELARELTDRGAHLVLAGPLSQDARIVLARDRPPRSLEVLGPITRREVAALLGRARIGLSVLRPLPNYRANYPTKLFEYMAAGIPSIVSNFPLWRDVVDRTGCGVAVDPLDARALVDSVVRLLEETEQAQAMGARGRVAVEERFNWECEAETLLRLYNLCLDGQPNVN